MRTEDGVLTAPLVVSDEVVVTGISPHAISVRAGGILHLKGICSGNVVIDKDGRAIIRGTVTGVVVNRGHLEVHGILEHEVINENGTVDVRSGAIIAGQRQS